MDFTLKKGIIIMIVSSFFTCIGQLIWELATLQNGEIIILYYLAGFFLYVIGALTMLIALRFGELSVLQPMLSFGYIVSIFLGYFVLNEPITIRKVMGIVIIIGGIIILSKAELEQKHD